jgi:hypothetical protein
MRKTISILLLSTFALGACGLQDSRVNPFNWFGQSRSEPVGTAPTESTNPLIPRGGGIFSGRRPVEAVYLGQPFQQVTDLTVEPVPGGAVIRATGLAERQGIYAVQLTPANEEELPVNGVLTYRLEGVLPSRATAIGQVPTREVIAARRLTDQQLRGVNVIRVEGQLNAQVARR